MEPITELEQPVPADKRGTPLGEGDTVAYAGVGREVGEVLIGTVTGFGRNPRWPGYERRGVLIDSGRSKLGVWRPMTLVVRLP